MPQSEILHPMLALMLVTMAVWILMYVRRIAYMRARRIPAQELATPDRVSSLIPERVQYPAHNLGNLFEMPVLFYALCLLLFVSGTADGLYVGIAWAFVALRAVHSAIQCTVNIVMLRFLAYIASSLLLWFMVLRAAWELL